MSKTRMGKRVASLLLSLVMMLSLLPTTVYATEDTVGGTGETNGVIVEETNTSDDNTVGGTTGNPEPTGEDEGGGAANVSEGETVTVATIDSTTYESLDAAITAVKDGETIVVNAGEYTLNGSLNYTGKAFTIAAAEGAKVSFDMSAAVALHGAKITFNNVTFDYKTNGNYIGLQHADTLVYDNCTINGVVFLYAVNETFNNCTFNQESADAYNVWTYGAQNVAFNGCTFNCVGKAVLVYNEGAIAKTDLTVTDTKFVASAPVTGKAAIEIDTSLMAGGATITVDDKTTDTGFATGSNSGKTLWNDKKQTADTNKNTTVTVAGETVFEPKATVVKPVSVNGTSYETLEDAIDAATPDANGVVTYEISGKVDVTATGWVQVAKSGLTGLTAVKFVGTTDDAKICINGGLAILADQNYDIDVSFEALALSKLNPTYGGDYGHSTNYFTTWLRNSGAAENTVTYTNCTFPNGVSNNQYGKTVFDNCKFTNGATGLYNLWNYGGSTEIKNSSFTGTRGIKAYSEGVDGGQIEVADTTFNGLGEKAAIVVSKATTVTLNKVDATECTKGLLQKDIDGGSLKTTIEANGTGISGKFDITATTTADAAKNEFNISAGTFTSEVSNDYCADGFEVKANDNGTYGVVEAATAAGDGTEAKPYTLEQLGAMTRKAYIEAQNRLNGTMYVTVGDYAYDTNGVLGNGVRDDTTGQIPDHSKLNAYGENGYLGEKNDGANGKSVVFVGGSITSGVTGYTSIDKIGTSLLLALPAYTNVTFKGITFNNVMSFNYQLYTSPWSQLGELKFDGCTFNGIIVGAIAAQTLTFNGCEFKNYTNTTYANSSNPTWIRPAYGNWTQGDNEGQGSDFRSLTTINFTDNKVTSTRPVKFEYISQWDITSTVTATGNSFDISKQDGDTTIKNVGLYLGAHTDANAFNLVAENNTKSKNTAALYTIPEGKTSLPLGSTVKDTKGNEVELTDALKWKAGDATTDKIVLKSVPLDTSVPAGYVEDEQGNVTISDEAGLFWFAKQANAGNNFAGKTVTLANDIALTKAWTPIGIYNDSKTHFKGTFDGQNHTVSGVEVTENRANGVGFFGKVYTGTIKNLTVEGTITTTGCNYVGGIVGHGYATISNCTFKGNVGSTNTMQVGGIAGSGGFTITNCSVYGNVTAECWAGGIVGNCQDGGAYTNCYVEGVISAGRSYWGGGAAGITPVPLYPSQVISSCYSNTVVKVAGKEVNCPIIAAYNNPLDYNGYTGDLKIYDNSWNKQKNSNNSYPIYAEKDGVGGVLVEGKDVSRDNNLVMLEGDLQYVTDLSKVRIMAGSAVTQAQDDALAAASIGTAKYITLVAAIAAAKDGETVTLLADATEDVTIDKNITLDLGGKTLTNTGAGKATVTIAKGATATVQNGSIIGGTSYYNIQNNGTATFTGVTATAGNTGSSMIDNFGTLTIESGSYTGGLDTIKNEPGAKLTISGGEFTLTKGTSKGFTGVVFNYGDLTITGGTFTQSDKSAPYGQAQVIHTDNKSGSSAPSTVITGGTFKNLCTRSTAWVVRATNAAAGATKVSGGTFNKSISDGYCADGFIPTKNADGTYGVKAGKYVAQIGSKKYETLADAIRLAAKGKTITLLDNVTENVEIAANKNLTLDLNGFTLNGGTGTAKAALYNLGTITIQDSSAAKTGTIKRDDAGIEGETSYYVIRNQGTMTIESGNVINNSGYRKVNSTGSMVGSSLICNGDCDEGGTLTIKGGTFTQNNFIAIKNGVLGVLKVTGGTITSNHSAIQNWFEADITGGKITGQLWTDAWEEGKSVGKTTIGGDATFAGEIVMDITGSVAPTLAINGGNLNVTRWRITNAAANAGAKPAVSGGTFSSAVKEEYCATGYIPKDNGDGTYGVKEGVYVAKVDNVKYETLQAAIDAAKGNSTVRLLANVTLTETAVFPAGKTVHLNLVGHNITATGTALRINGTTDIQDTYKTGTIESTGNVAVAVGNNASLTVYSGTLKGREGAVITGTSTGAKIEIKKNATLIATDNAVIAGNGSQRDGNPNTILVRGGTFIGGIVTDGYIACGIYAPWNDNVTVSGGTFNITNGAGIVARAGTVKVTGGTFNCTGTAEGYVGDSKNKVPCAALVFDKAAKYPALTESSQILVSGGSFSTDPAVNGATLADGYVATQTDGMYKVAKADPTAEINGVKYDTLQAAINAAQATKGGATITLLKNINTESYYMVNGDNPVTIDLAGYNITGSGISGLFYVTAKGDLTIKGKGTVTAVEDNGAAMAVWVRSPIAKVTLEGGTYTQQITNTADPHFDLIYVERGNVYVKGGTYKGATPDWTLNCYDEYYQSKEANIEVTGGTFVGFDPANNKAEGENTNFVPAGYVSTKGADGNYTVEEYKPVEVWTGYSGAKVASYATVAEAAEKLDGNKWIVIGKDYTLTEDFTIGGENLDNLYLDVAEGATLTVAEGVTLTVAANAKRLGVRDGATLVNKGTIVVCGSSTSNGFAMLYGTFTGNELTVPEGCFLDNNGKNFFATANENAVYEITFGDGTVKKTADSTNIKGGNVKQIKLLKDVTNGGWTLDSSSVGAEVVLDLNGHTISYNGANRYYATLNVYTKVTIKNGTVKYEGSKRGAIDLVGQGDLTIERDVTIDGGDGFAIFTSGTSKLTVNGKVTANGNYAIAGNGSKDAGGYIDSCDIIVNGGAVISASKGIAIYHPEKGTVTINGGTITGHTGIEMCAGQLVVNGGSITSNGDNMDATGSQNAILDGAAISIINRNYPGGVPTAVIKGGTFAANGKDAQTVKAYDYTGDKVAEWTAAGDNVNISGGTFSSIPTNMGVLCADGYKTVYDAYADMYNVVKQDAKITVGKRLSIGNDLTITYLVSMTDCTNPWVKFQFYNDDIKGYTTVEVKNYGTDTVTGPDGKPMDVFTFDFTGINPQRMTDTLKATVYAKDANGNVVEYQVDDYSVAQYCSNKLAKLGQNDPLRKLIGNLVAYGAAAQVYQNYRTDNLVSTVVSGAVSTDYTDRLSSVTQYTEKVLGTAGVNIKGKTLVLSNTFAVRVYFTVNKGVDIANVSFNVTANGKTDTVNSFEKDEKLGYYYFDYANLNATQLDSEVKFESFVNETGVGDMVTYSVNTYLAKKMPNYDKSSNAYKLMAELFNYGCACTEYASK